MLAGRRIALLVLVSVSSVVACGKSGQRETRPAELLYRVSGVSGTSFVMDTACSVSGIQATNADHQFGDRVFTAPHFFILENASQPVRAGFEVPPGESEGIRVDLFIGFQQTQTREVLPGECETVRSGQPCIVDGDCPEDQVCQESRCDFVVPMVRGHEVRIELCGSIDMDEPCSNNDDCPRGEDCSNARCRIRSNARCGDFDDSFVGFFASLGDLKEANVTSCNTRPISEACRTPATLFVEDPQETISAVFDTLGSDSPDAEIRAELYIDGNLVESSTGKRNVQVSEDL